MFLRSLTVFRIVLIAMLAGVSAWSQPILTQLTLPAPTKVIKLNWCDTTGVVPGPAGNGVVWNFSQLRLRTQKPDSMLLRYLPMSALPPEIRDSFPTGQVGIVDDTVTTICAIVGSTFQVLGTVSTNSNATSVPVDPYDSRPTELTYNDPFTDTWRAVVRVKIVPATLQRAGLHRIVYDGFGTLILRDSTIAGVARIKDSLTITDTSRQGPALFIATTKIENVTWLRPEENVPLLQIQSSSTTTTRNGTPFGQRVITKSVRYDASTTVATSVEESTFEAFSVTPNPASGNVIRIGPWESQPTRVVFYGADGSAIVAGATSRAADGYWNVELPSVSNGMYTVLVELGGVQTGNNVRVARVVVLR